MSQKFDSNLKDKQLLYIGKKYENTHLLIVGESLYTDDEHMDEFHDKDILGKIIRQNAIDKEVKLFKNLNRTLMGTEGGYNTQAIWESVAYCEFIPRILDYTDYAEQPNADDFEKGKAGFEKIIKILEPRYCLFLGVRAIDCLGGEKMKNNYNHVWARKCELKYDGGKVACMGIKHPSSFFSWKKWSKFLVSNNSSIKGVIINEIRKVASVGYFVTQHPLIENNNWTWVRKENYLIFRESTSYEHVDFYAEFDFNIMEMSYGFAVKKKLEKKTKKFQDGIYSSFIEKFDGIEKKFQYCGYNDGWLLFSDGEFSLSNFSQKWNEIYDTLKGEMKKQN